MINVTYTVHNSTFNSVDNDKAHCW